MSVDTIDYNCENLSKSERQKKLRQIEKTYGPYSDEAQEFRQYLLQLDVENSENRGMPDINSTNAVNGHDYDAPGVSYSVIIMHDYWSEGRVGDDGSWIQAQHYDVIYKIVYGPFATKGQALNNKERANRRNSEAGLPEDCWVPEPKYLGGKKWYVQVAALGDLDKINDILGKLGFKKIADDHPKQKEETKPVEQKQEQKPVPVPDVKPVITPAPYDPAMLNQLFNDYQKECAQLHDLISRATTISACDFAESDYKVVQTTKAALDVEIKYAKTMNFDTKDYEAVCLGDVPDLLKAKRIEIENWKPYDPKKLKAMYKQYEDECNELHALISSAKTPADCDNNDKKYQDALYFETSVNNEIADAKANDFDTRDYNTDCLKDVQGLLNAKRKEIEGQNKPLDLNDQTVKDSVDKAIGSINKATDPDKLDTLTDVTNAKKVIQTTSDYASGLYNLDLNKDQLEQVGAFENKINGHKKRLDDALSDRELYLRNTQNGAKDNDNKKIPALAAGQGTISVPGIDPQALQQGRNKLTGGSGEYKVSLSKEDLPIMGEKRVIAFLDIADKLYGEENVRDEAKNKFYKKILKALGNKNTLTFENSYQLEHDTQYVFAATLSLFWAYVFVNAKGSIFDSDFTGKGSTLDKIMNGQIKRSDVTISEYQYQKVAQGAE